MILKKLIASLVIATMSHSAFAIMLTTAEKLADFDYLWTSIESSYGPFVYKQKSQKINLPKIKRDYENKIRNTKSNGEYYYLVNQFVAEFHDGHFSSYIPTDHKKTLPILTDYIEGKVIVTMLNKAKLGSKVDLDVGDQILEVNDSPALQVLDKIQSYSGSGYELTEKRLAAFRLFRRSGSTLPVPKAKTVKIKFEKHKSGKVHTVTLDWEEEGIQLDEILPKDSDMGIFQVGTQSFDSSIDYDMIGTFDTYAEIISDTEVGASYMCNGDSRISAPKGATYIMKKPFVAYYYPTPVGNIGYLRIPHYFPRNDKGEWDGETRYAQYQYAIALLEQQTVGLVIDQDHNCGGSVSYLEDLVGLFVRQPFKPMQFTLRANKENFLGYKSWLEKMGIAGSTTIDGMMLTRLFKIMTDSWIKGDFMTPAVAIDGSAVKFPAPLGYSKPIVVLIDEMSGSGGDAFPSMMKGFGRAKLLGTRTSGLGGHVGSIPPLPYSRININITKSLFYRPDGVAVENNGAVPDINYSMTVKDLVEGYKPYREFYTKAIMDMVRAESKK